MAAARPVLREVSFDDLPGWKAANTQDFAGSMEAFRRGCDRWNFLGNNYDLGLGFGKVSWWKPVCNKAKKVKSASQFKAFFEKNFVPKRVGGPANESLFTGYFELELDGSLVQDETHRYPVYAVPEDIQKGASYFSREEIEAGALSGKGLEIAYVSDPVRLFFLHIQGSGRIRLQDGSILRVGYHGQNGHKYYSIGRELVDRGIFTLEEVSALKIQDWLYQNPQKRDRILNLNPSYVFFRVLNGEDKGAYGSMSVPLVEGYTMAVDKRYLPMGTPLWLVTTIPGHGEGEAPELFRRLMMAQDTGGAIKGMVRGDIFFGAGEEAEWRASHMRSEGEYYVLVPR